MEMACNDFSIKLLFAEDDASVRNFIPRVVSILLQDRKLDIELFPDGTSLVERLDKGISAPGVVITDNDMPGYFGKQIIQSYSSRPDFASIPFVLISADSCSPKELESIGAYSYLSKPFNIRDFGEVLNRAIDYSIQKSKDQNEK